jgi:hypothetical protein
VHPNAESRIKIQVEVNSAVHVILHLQNPGTVSSD